MATIVIHISIMQRTSSHEFENEVGRYTLLSLEERTCQLCHEEVESSGQPFWFALIVYPF